MSGSDFLLDDHPECDMCGWRHRPQHQYALTLGEVTDIDFPSREFMAKVDVSLEGVNSHTITQGNHVAGGDPENRPQLGTPAQLWSMWWDWRGWAMRTLGTAIYYPTWIKWQIERQYQLGYTCPMDAIYLASLIIEHARLELAGATT